MIRVVYDRANYKVTVDGHAGSAERGRDLVCAAVSTLVMTLASNAVHLVGTRCVDEHTIIVEEGKSLIKLSPVRKMRHVVLNTMDSICAGFDVLVGLCPEFISYQVIR